MHLHEKIVASLQGKLQRQKDAVLITEAHLQIFYDKADEAQLVIPDTPSKAEGKSPKS